MVLTSLLSLIFLTGYKKFYSFPDSGSIGIGIKNLDKQEHLLEFNVQIFKQSGVLKDTVLEIILPSGAYIEKEIMFKNRTDTNKISEVKLTVKGLESLKLQRNIEVVLKLPFRVKDTTGTFLKTNSFVVIMTPNSIRNKSKIEMRVSTDTLWHLPYVRVCYLPKFKEKVQMISPYFYIPTVIYGQGELKFAISTKGKVEVAIYDLKNRPVATIIDKILPAGVYSFEIKELTNNVYFLYISTPDYKVSQKFVYFRE